jgi:hypothetical protein
MHMESHLHQSLSPHHPCPELNRLRQGSLMEQNMVKALERRQALRHQQLRFCIDHGYGRTNP